MNKEELVDAIEKSIKEYVNQYLAHLIAEDITRDLVNIWEHPITKEMGKKKVKK